MFLDCGCGECGRFYFGSMDTGEATAPREGRIFESYSLAVALRSSGICNLIAGSGNGVLKLRGPALGSIGVAEIIGELP